MKIGVYPGSFDPFTFGHLEIAMRSVALVDRLHISVGHNAEKKGGMFNNAERKFIIMKTLSLFSTELTEKFFIDSYDGLLIDHAKKIDANFIFRGIRPVSDFDGEWNLQGINHDINPNIDTVMLFSHPKYHHTSSSALKQLIKHGHNAHSYAPAFVQELIEEKLNEK